MSNWEVVHGDCLEVLKRLPDGCIDSVVTDPPYELGFMGKAWDKSGVAFNPETWRAVFRVLKPGGHLLAFGGTRTVHRIACAIEDAGFDIRDQLSWLYGTGFPKSLDVSKAIDTAAGAAKQWAGWGTAMKPATEPVVFAMKPVDDWGTIGSCLSSLHASIAVEISTSSRSAFVEAFVSALMGAGPLPAMSAGLSAEIGTSPPGLATGTSLSIVSSWLDSWAALSALASTFIIETVTSPTIDSKILSFCLSRIMDASTRPIPVSELSWLVSTAASQFLVARLAFDTIRARSVIADAIEQQRIASLGVVDNAPIVLARKPLIGTVAANVLAHGTGALNIDACRIDGVKPEMGPRTSTVVAASSMSGESTGHTTTGRVTTEGRWPANVLLDEEAATLLDEQADASRFFYVAKAARKERDLGCEHLPPKSAGEATDREEDTDGLNSPRAGAGRTGGARNYHPTVKPVQLMRYLVRLVTPPGGVVLDPFTGSGTTGVATIIEGFDFLGVERELDYCEIARSRIAAVSIVRVS